QHVGQFVGFPKPVSNRCLDFIAVLDVNDVVDLRLRRRIAPSHLRSLQRATEKHADFEKVLLRTYEEVAGFAREHDRFVRGVNPLIAKGNGGLSQPLPSIPQIVGEFPRQSRFSGRPTVVLFSVLDPLLAVVALSTGHTSELYWRLSKNCIAAPAFASTPAASLCCPCRRRKRGIQQRESLLQLRVLGFGLLQDGDVMRRTDGAHLR